jgi:hypothetical protein
VGKKNDQIDDLELKKKIKKVQLQNTVCERQTFDLYVANLEKAKELMGKSVSKNYRLKFILLR